MNNAPDWTGIKMDSESEIQCRLMTIQAGADLFNLRPRHLRVANHFTLSDHLLFIVSLIIFFLTVYLPLILPSNHVIA